MALLLFLASLVCAAPHASAQVAPAEASILVDADTGAVISQQNVHTPLPPASTIKVVTAYIAAERLPANDAIPVSALAEAMPALKINMKAGQVWSLPDVLNSLLIVSANDAAVALAERVGGGSLERWEKVAEEAARRMGMRDNPQLFDPAGLDDEFSYKGGSTISAWDLAIAARAMMSRPDLAAIVSSHDYRFTGGDGIGHVIRSHNLLLSLYPGAIGVKTGYTRRAGRSLIGAAERDGRRMIALVIRAGDPYATVSHLLDQGFATPVTAEKGLPHLPPVKAGAARFSTVDQAARAATPAAPVKAVPRVAQATPPAGRSILDLPVLSVLVFLAGGLPMLVVLRRRAVVRARAERRRERRRADARLVSTREFG